MNHWAFVIAAYGITLVAATVMSLWAWRTARAAERRAAQLLERD
jgi:hypothetical protein